MCAAWGFRATSWSRPAWHKGQVVIDPFTGQSLSREELLERLEPFQRARGLTGENEIPLGLYLQPCPPRDIVARMLRNLERNPPHRRRLAPPAGRARALGAPAARCPRRARPWLVLAELGQLNRAADDLGSYLVKEPTAIDHTAIRARWLELMG